MHGCGGRIQTCQPTLLLVALHAYLCLRCDALQVNHGAWCACSCIQTKIACRVAALRSKLRVHSDHVSVGLKTLPVLGVHVPKKPKKRSRRLLATCMMQHLADWLAFNSFNTLGASKQEAICWLQEAVCGLYAMVCSNAGGQSQLDVVCCNTALECLLQRTAPSCGCAFCMPRIPCRLMHAFAHLCTSHKVIMLSVLYINQMLWFLGREKFGNSLLVVYVCWSIIPLRVCCT